MSRVRGDTLIDQANLASGYTYDMLLDGYPRLAFQATFTDATPVAQSFPDTDVDIINDKILAVNHGFATGTKGRFTTTGTLPSGLSLLTDYWIIRDDVDNFKVALTYSDALSNNPVNLNSIGTGTHTFTPSALSGGVLKGQASNDGLAFVDVPSLFAPVDSSGTAMFNITEPAYRHFRLLYIPSAGSINLKVVLNAHDVNDGTFALHS